MMTVTEWVTGVKGFVMYSMKKSLLVYLAFYCTELEREHSLTQALIPRAGLPSQPKSTMNSVRQVLPLQIFLVVIKTCKNQPCGFAQSLGFRHLQNLRKHRKHKEEAGSS